jgi:adenylate kinase
MIVIVTGAPGAGKGTQSDLLSARCGFKKLSTGDALRKHVRLGTSIGKVAGAVMEKGQLVSDDLLLQVLGEELKGFSRSDVVLLDGYPRNLGQAKALEGLGGSHKIAAVLHLDVDRGELVGRLSGRRVCGGCGATFHVLENPSRVDGVCDKCGGSLEQRPDDRSESVAVRLDVYEKTTMPILEFYRAKGLYFRVDGKGTPEEIYSRLMERMRGLELAHGL